MSEKLISVIIPAYNHEKYVQETIQSVIDQTYQNIELIIIDDGSKDSTFQKIQEMEEKCQKRFVHFLYQTQLNQGTCITQNHLAQLAHGEYLALIASDDKYTSNALTDMLKEMEKNSEVALVVGKNYIMDGDSRKCYWDKNRENVYDKNLAKWTSFSDFLMDVTEVNFYSIDFGTYVSLVRCNHIPNGYLIRKSIFEKTGGYKKEAPLEDYWIMLQLSKYGKMKYIDVPTFYYRWHNANTVKQKEKMKKMMKDTLFYEYNLANKYSDSFWAKEFFDVYYKTEIIFKIGSIISLIKVTTLRVKQKILKFFGFSFILKNKNRF